MTMHEMQGKLAIAAWCGPRRYYWTGTGFSDQGRSARKYQGNHEVMAAVTRLRRDQRSLGAQIISVVDAPRGNELPPQRAKRS